MEKLEEDPPKDLKDWPDDENKYQTFGGPEGHHGYEEGPEAKLGPNNPVWPCAGGCASCGGANRNCGLVTQVGNTLPGLLAGVLVIGRRRRKKPPAKVSAGRAG